jgi:hypothetical protein
MAQRNVKRARAGTLGDGDGEHAGAAALVRTGRHIQLPQYETIALMLQGGGALGAYQAGVYQGLHETGIDPNWIAGISIGALNTAIIAGNAPEHRVDPAARILGDDLSTGLCAAVAAVLRAIAVQFRRHYPQGLSPPRRPLARSFKGSRDSLCRAFRRPCQPSPGRRKTPAITTRHP